MLTILAVTLASAYAGTITAPTRKGLQDALDTGNATFGVSEVIFTEEDTSVSAAAVVTNGKSITGAYDSNYVTQIYNITLGLITESKNFTGLDLPYYDQIYDNIDSYVSPLAYETLSVIKSNGVKRVVTGYIATIESGKYIRMELNHNGLSMSNVRIGEVEILYEFTGNPSSPIELPIETRSGIVNSFIGNNTKASGQAYLNNFVNNDFNNIDITVQSTLNNNNSYLAGGGIIGVRSTTGSAQIKNIYGNLFRNITITTTGTSDTAAGPYIQGGGIIGLNAVFNPAETDGTASIDHLYNNIFTNIKVTSADLLMGGGIIGLNNNSLNSNDATKVSIDIGISRSIFGNSLPGNIEITTRYGIHGGGIIGLNSFQYAGLYLGPVVENIFTGININAGTLITGGGIIGLQNKDENGKFANQPDKYPAVTAIDRKSVV
jgi:hypothetical protein